MTAPDQAAAVQIAQKALNERRGFGNVQAGYAEAVVAALDEAELLRRPDEAAYVAALEAENRRLRGAWTSPPVTTSGYDLATQDREDPTDA